PRNVLRAPLALLRSSSVYHDDPYAPIQPLSLHDALPISSSVAPAAASPAASPASSGVGAGVSPRGSGVGASCAAAAAARPPANRSEEHTSELQSRENLVCRPLLEKKKSSNVGSRADVRGL